MQKISDLNDAQSVRSQYAQSDRLDIRIALHAKYSTNKQGFGSWIADHYRFEACFDVLELGCGTGEMWVGRDALISECRRLILSDYSNGMLDRAKLMLNGYSKIEFETIDIQDIPHPEASFDAVIANMVLYHVPDIDKALREVRRVLRPRGTFYCATYGENGMMEYLYGLFGITADTNRSFTLQSGEKILRRHFVDVRRYDYPDSLYVTDLSDMLRYIRSLGHMSALATISDSEIIEVLKKHSVNGALSIPKEYGIFICG